MKDILLEEKCEYCKGNLTLMESINTDTGATMLVKRCLTCFSHKVEEVIQVIGEYDERTDNMRIKYFDDDVKYLNDKLRFNKNNGINNHNPYCTIYFDKIDDFSDSVGNKITLNIIQKNYIFDMIKNDPRIKYIKSIRVIPKELNQKRDCYELQVFCKYRKN